MTDRGLGLFRIRIAPAWDAPAVIMFSVGQGHAARCRHSKGKHSKCRRIDTLSQTLPWRGMRTEVVACVLRNRGRLLDRRPDTSARAPRVLQVAAAHVSPHVTRNQDLGHKSTFTRRVYMNKQCINSSWEALPARRHLSHAAGRGNARKQLVVNFKDAINPKAHTCAGRHRHSFVTPRQTC